MAAPEILTQSPDDLVDGLACGLVDSAYLLPEASRKGRIRPSLEDCRAIARKPVKRLKAKVVTELRRRVGRPHSSPPVAAEG